MWNFSKLWDMLLIKGNTVSLSKALEERLDPMKMDRVKKYAVHISGAYYRAPEEQFR